MGPPPGWQPGPPPQPPKKGGNAVVIAVVAAVVGVLVLAGGAVFLLRGNNEPVASVIVSPSTLASTASAEPSSTAETEPSTEPSTEPEPTSTGLPGGDDEGNEAVFLAALRQRADLKDKPSAELVRLGRDMCGEMDAGKSLIQVALGHAEELGAETSGYIAGAAVVGLCPRHRDKVPS